MHQIHYVRTSLLLPLCPFPQIPAAGGSSLEGGTFFTATPMELASEIGWNVDQSDAVQAHI